MPPEQPKLLGHEEREDLVRSCSLALTGFPSNDWMEPLSALSRSLNSFQGNFEPLIESNILYNLCQLFRPEYSEIPWRSEVAQLLTDMVCLNKTSGFFPRLLVYDFIKFICQILTNGGQPMPMSQSSNYLYLLGNIAGDNIKARNATIQAGAVPILHQLLDQAVLEYDIELLTWMVSNFVKSDDEGHERS